MTPPVTDRTRRPTPPYNPEREEHNEHVLVFYDVPPIEWATTPQKLGDVMVSSIWDASARSDELHRMPYEDYLRTDEWKAMRRRIIVRAEFRCEWCGKHDQKWNVHHLTYERRGFERLEDLALLCEPCHKTHHGIEHD